MERPRVLLLVALVLILSCGRFVARAEVDNVITQWQFVAQKVVRTLGVPSQIASRDYTLLHLSQYKALQLAHKTSGVHPEAAAAYAAHYVLSEIYPTQQSTTFDAVIAKQIFPLKLSEAEDEATREVGLKFAKSLLKKRTYDGSQAWAKFTPAPPGGPTGKYQFTPNQTYALYPQLATSRPFLVKSVKPFDKYGGPYPIPSAQYNTEYDELATIGNANSSKNTPAFKATALFWEAGANTSTINAQLLNATLKIIKNDTTVEQTASLFAKINVAQYDSAVAGWQQKYKYLFWRPITALRQGDPSHKPILFTPVLKTPPHPEYPSTHSTAAGSWAAVLAKYLGIGLSEKVPNGSYTVLTEGYFLPPRTYETLEAAEVEVGLSRKYGGIHFQKSIDNGLSVGQDVGYYVWEHFEEHFGEL